MCACSFNQFCTVAVSVQVMCKQYNYIYNAVVYGMSVAGALHQVLQSTDTGSLIIDTYIRICTT